MLQPLANLNVPRQSCRAASTLPLAGDQPLRVLPLNELPGSRRWIYSHSVRDKPEISMHYMCTGYLRVGSTAHTRRPQTGRCDWPLTRTEAAKLFTIALRKRSAEPQSSR
jgi:hypothetical protein